MPLLKDVTIVVPTRNEAANIRGFLASLPPDIALIVVDKSTDETPELIKRHRPLNTAVLDYQGTLTEARQLGAERARTSWLLFTDADIVFADDYFERLSQLLADCGSGRGALRSEAFARRIPTLLSRLCSRTVAVAGAANAGRERLESSRLSEGFPPRARL